MAVDPDTSLLDQLGDLPAELIDEPMETYTATDQATDQATVSFDANWKVYTDNFVEGYHIPGTPPPSTPPSSLRRLRRLPTPVTCA